MKALYINTNRLGYTPEQCPRTMTVGANSAPGP